MTTRWGKRRNAVAVLPELYEEDKQKQQATRRHKKTKLQPSTPSSSSSSQHSPIKQQNKKQKLLHKRQVSEETFMDIKKEPVDDDDDDKEQEGTGAVEQQQSSEQQNEEAAITTAALSAADADAAAAIAAATEVDFVNKEVPDEKKPDLLELQQELLKQQQQQLMLQQNMQATRTAIALQPPSLPPNMLTPGPGGPLFIIGDLNTLQLAQLNALRMQPPLLPLATNTTTSMLNNNNSNISNSAFVQSGGSGVIAVNKNIFTSDAGVIKSDAVASTTNAATKATKKSATNTKYLNDSFVPDEFDLQESDYDEDGYSDIDLDEDELFEDDELSELYDPDWANIPTTLRRIFSFEIPVLDIGLKGRPKGKEPKIYFNMMVGPKFFIQLAESVNERAEQKLQTQNVGKTYFKPANGQEMQIFFALCLQMSTFKLPILSDYWDEQIYHGFSGFASKMSLNRFRMLLKLLNFNRLAEAAKTVTIASSAEEQQQLNEQKAALADFTELVEFFNKRMQTIYVCGQRLVLNEPLRYWKGKLNCVNEMNDKFRCNAITLHLLTERTGLVLKLLPDVESEEHKKYGRNSNLLVNHRVAIAKELLREQLNSGRGVYASKYYASYGLCYELCNAQTYCTGLLDEKRYGNSKQLIVTKLGEPSFATKYAPYTMMGKWRYRQKCLYFYSSDCLAIYPQETSLRLADNRPKIIKELYRQLQLPPKIREDMLLYQIGVERKQMKWDKQMAIYVFNLMMLNSYIFYSTHARFRRNYTDLNMKDNSFAISYEEFRQEIIAMLLRTTDTEELNREHEIVVVTPHIAAVNSVHMSDEDETETESPRKPDAAKLLEVEHLPMIIPRRKGKVMKKKCRICRKGGMLKFTKLCCEICPGMPGLCETPCFQIWHQQLKRSLESGQTLKYRQFGTCSEESIYF